MTSLPTEIEVKILSYLPAKDVWTKVGSLNTHLHHTIRRANRQFWYTLYIRNFKNPGFKFDKVNWQEAYKKKQAAIK